MGRGRQKKLEKEKNDRHMQGQKDMLRQTQRDKAERQRDGGKYKRDRNIAI